MAKKARRPASPASARRQPPGTEPPDKGVFEDPVTGSAHCAVVPYWAKRLGKRELRAYQASPRGGDLLCTNEGERVVLAGPCALYLKGEIEF